MRTTHHASAVSETATVIAQVTKRQGNLRLEPATRKEELMKAGILLVTMFDQAMIRANHLQAQTGAGTAIRLRHHRQEARCYHASAPQGEERKLVLFISLPLEDGDLFGGAYIRPSCAQSALYVLPKIGAEAPRWLIQESGAELTPAVVDDLFRATFSDDADAALRLAPHYGFDLFTTPWS
jgi:hypothetical protein